MQIQIKYCLILVIIFCMINTLGAQDIIHLKNKSETVEAKVVEIGTGEIKYKLWEGREDGLIYVVEKTNVSYIEFESGRTEFFGQEVMDSEEYFAGQDKRALKISFLAPLGGYTSVNYEQNISPGRSWEARVAFVGLGLNPGDRDSKGFIGAFGYKLYKKPSFVTSDTRRRHILQGGYFKPEIFVGNTSFDTGFGGSSDERKSETTFGLLLNLGSQWIIGDSFLINIVGGIGYGGGECFSAYWVEKNTHIAGTLSVDIGFTF